MKTLIVVESSHHGNTAKVVQALADAYGEITVMPLEEGMRINFAEYQWIGLASGINNGSMYDGILQFAEKIPAGKKTFLIYTAGNENKDYGGKMREVLKKKGAKVMGSFHCKGWDTYGFFGILGGINRNRPNTGDLSAAVDFYHKLTGSTRDGVEK